jgi:hypothetical protein
MHYITCSYCHKSDVQLNKSIKIDEKPYCSDCISAVFTEDELKSKRIEKEFDPTVCFSCGKDFDDTILNRISDYPVCLACEQSIKNKAFPKWVKAFFIGVLTLVAFSFFSNYRFIEAYSNLKKSSRALEEKDYKTAADEFKSAHDNIPEINEIGALASFYNGINLLNDDKSTEALAEFIACKDFVPRDLQIENYITQAEMGSGFDTKNYHLFLNAAKKNLQIDTTIAMSWAGVASAYACLYGSSKTDSIKVFYDYYLGKSLSLNDTTKEFSNYINRLRYRFATGDILTKEEFDKKFPYGTTNY